MKKKKVQPKDPKKESLFASLSKVLEEAGYEVRRESLKRGHGWKAISGSCRLEGQDMIFVDRRMSQDEQIGFLKTKIAGLKLEVPGADVAAQVS